MTGLIVVTGYAGWDGSYQIYQHAEYQGKLLERYPECFFGISAFLAPVQSRRTAEEGPLERLLWRFFQMKADGCAMEAAEGGVLAALWQLLKAHNSGGKYALSAIPLLQQTVEICEMFALNPYRLYSPSCRVWLAEQPGEILSDAAGAGMPSAVIGSMAEGVPIWRTDTEVPSSLRRPSPDELHRLAL